MKIAVVVNLSKEKKQFPVQKEIAILFLGEKR